MRPAPLVLVIVSVCACGSAKHVAANRPIVPVLHGARDLTSPAADGGDLAWTAGGKRFAQTATLSGDVFVRRAGSAPRRINPSGTSGMTGGLDAGRLVYQELDDTGSHLRLYDLRARRFLPLPASVRRARPIVWKPTLSGPYLLFGRLGGGWDVLLTDLRSGRTRVLARNRAHAGYAVPGQVNGRYAVWTWCSEEACSVWEYDIGSERARRLPIGNLYRSGVEGPSVAPDGTVYYGQGGLSCGSGVSLYRYGPGRGISKLAALPPGIDFQYSFAERARGGVRVLFDRYDCGRKRFDIAAVLDPTG